MKMHGQGIDVFNVPLKDKVRWRWGYSLESYPTACSPWPTRYAKIPLIKFTNTVLILLSL